MSLTPHDDPQARTALFEGITNLVLVSLVIVALGVCIKCSVGLGRRMENLSRQLSVKSAGLKVRHHT